MLFVRLPYESHSSLVIIGSVRPTG